MRHFLPFPNLDSCHFFYSDSVFCLFLKRTTHLMQVHERAQTLRADAERAPERELAPRALLQQVLSDCGSRLESPERRGYSIPGVTCRTA